jgi:hypothetical protein
MTEDELRALGWLSDEELQGLHSASSKSPVQTTGGPFYTNLPDPYPTVPDFGILYLRVSEAAAILSEDLYETGRYPFSDLQNLDHTESQLEAQKAELPAQLTARIQAHLMRAIGAGRLPAFSRTGSLEDFLANGDEPLIAERLYIHCGALRKWLGTSGYAAQWFLSHGPALAAYEAFEITLAREIETLIRSRRSSRDSRYDRRLELDEIDMNSEKLKMEFMSTTFYHEFEMESPKNIKFVEFKTVFERALWQIQDLKKQLHRALNPPPLKDLGLNESRSVLTLLAAVCRWKGINRWSRDLASRVERETEEMGRPLSDNTIRKWLNEAIGLASGSVPGRKK